MLKTVIIGAGSGFGGRLSIDIMSNERLRNSKICLCDLHEGRLKKVEKYLRNTIEKHDLPTIIESSTDRTELLPDADFVITSVSVGGGAYYGHPYKAEIEIPRKYGVDQIVGDTCGVGAVFRFLRTGPVHLQIFKDIERLCPDALALNHTNPMAMLTWLHHKETSVENVGLCHGIYWTSRKIAKMLGIPVEELYYDVAGINHLAWFLKLQHKDKDLYPELKKLINNPELSEDQELREEEEVRFEILKQFNYFSTESPRHDSEYLPYFRRTQELLDNYNLERRQVEDEPGKVREWMEDTGPDDSNKVYGELRKSNEYTTGIMEAVLTDEPYKFNGNVMNEGLITNLPEGSCVEVPCMVDKQGVHPCYVGDLPSHLAGLDRTNINVQELAVEAVIEKDKEKAFQACALSPLTASKLSLPEIREMFNELWEAEKDLLLWFDPSHEGPVPEKYAD